MMLPIQERMAKYTDEKVAELKEQLNTRIVWVANHESQHANMRFKEIEQRLAKLEQPTVACGNDPKDKSGAPWPFGNPTRGLRFVPTSEYVRQMRRGTDKYYDAQRDNDRLRIENAKQEATINTMAKVIGNMKEELAVAKGDRDYWKARSRRFEKELFNHLVNHPIDTL